MTTRVITAIQQALANRDDTVIIEERRQLLQTWINQYGLDVVAAATGLKPSTLMQYSREKRPSIGYDAIDQGKFVFANDEVIKAINQR